MRFQMADPSSTGHYKGRRRTGIQLGLVVRDSLPEDVVLEMSLTEQGNDG